MFQFPSLASGTYVFSAGSRGFAAGGFPIRKSPGQSLLGGSPELIAACHVLLRLLTPGHPPCALVRLTTTQRMKEIRTAPSESVVKERGGPTKAPRISAPAATSALRAKVGGGERDRTDGLLVANQALSQLSYTPETLPPAARDRHAIRSPAKRRMVGLGRLELPTSRLSGVRSSHLSYRPKGADRSKLNREGSAYRTSHMPRRRSPRHVLHRKEVIQPQVPLRLPCYDFTPITDHTLDAYIPCGLAQRLLVQPAFVV
jgi:hypothetical protein